MCNSEKCGWDRLAGVDTMTSRFVSPQTLLAFRAVAFLWHFPVAIYIAYIHWTPPQDDDKHVPIAVTLSWLSYCCVSLYFLLAMTVTFANRSLFKQASPPRSSPAYVLAFVAARLVRRETLWLQLASCRSVCCLLAGVRFHV